MAPRQTGSTRDRCHCLARAATLFAAAAMVPTASSALEQVIEFGSNPGDIVMYLHRPSNLREGLPLVVALHGCTQSASSFDDETGLVALAEEVPFLLLLPEQREANMSRRCFRWYDEADNQPLRGESASILQMIDHAITVEGADPDRVHVMGLSAGGAMSAVMMANYPNRFAGGAIFAGLPFGCNRPSGLFDFAWNWLHYNPFSIDGADASYACGVAGFTRTNRSAQEWADYVTSSSDASIVRWPTVSIWQGTGDGTVDPDNLRELAEQWTAVHGIDPQADEQQIVGDATRETYLDDTGRARVETWSIEGFPHAFPVDTNARPDTCGKEADYIRNADLCAVRKVMEFWQLK